MVDYWSPFRTWGRLRSFPHRYVEGMKRYQLSRFEKLLEHAYTHVSMYRKYYEDKDFHPLILRRISRRAGRSVLTKSFIRDFPVHERIAQRSLDSKVHNETTSDST